MAMIKILLGLTDVGSVNFLQLLCLNVNGHKSRIWFTANLFKKTVEKTNKD